MTRRVLLCLTTAVLTFVSQVHAAGPSDYGVRGSVHTQQAVLLSHP